MAPLQMAFFYNTRSLKSCCLTVQTKLMQILYLSFHASQVYNI